MSTPALPEGVWRLMINYTKAPPSILGRKPILWSGISHHSRGGDYPFTGSDRAAPEGEVCAISGVSPSFSRGIHYDNSGSRQHLLLVDVWTGGNEGTERLPRFFERMHFSSLERSRSQTCGVPVCLHAHASRPTSLRSITPPRLASPPSHSEGAPLASASPRCFPDEWHSGR